MDKVLEDLKPWAKEDKLMDFVHNAENVGKLTGLADDIRDAMMDYQVRTRTPYTSLYLKLSQDRAAARHLQQELRAHCE